MKTWSGALLLHGRPAGPVLCPVGGFLGLQRCLLLAENLHGVVEVKVRLRVECIDIGSIILPRKRVEENRKSVLSCRQWCHCRVKPYELLCYRIDLPDSRVDRLLRVLLEGNIFSV